VSFNTNIPSASVGKLRNEEIAPFAIRCLRQGRGAQAFLLLSEPGADKTPEASFALGLCNLLSGDASAAVSCFEKALGMLKGMPASRPPAGENSEKYIRLTVEQVRERVYLTPMDADFCTHFPEAAEQTVLLALIHAYLQKGMTDQAKRLSSGLTGPEFEEYKKKFQ